jgi:hypothetical protein
MLSEISFLKPSRLRSIGVAAFLGVPLEIANTGNRRICIRNVILARCEILWGIAVSGDRRLLLFR